MITPRRSRLVRVPDLRRFQQAIALASMSRSPFQARQTAVLVPTTSAADTLRHTLEDLWLIERWVPSDEDRRLLEAGDPPQPAPGGFAAVGLPHLVTRSGLYDLLHERLPQPPDVLGRIEREVLLGSAAAGVVAAGVAPPFAVRPALLAAMLDFYDALARRRRSVDDFERLVGASLETGAAIDRGARRLLQQTRFLAAAFRAYQAALAGTGAVDEAGLRLRLIDEPAPHPVRSVVVTLPDQASSPHGLWPADYDLLTRLPGLESLVIVATEAVLASGYLPRLLDTLPDIDVVALAPDDRPAPVIVSPPRPVPVFVSRDREEEIAGFAQRLRRQPLPAPEQGAVALVYQRPLPYLYLARQGFHGEGVSWQALDALPLAAEPWAAALDAVLAFITSGWSRSTGVALLESPQIALAWEGQRPSREAVAACDRALLDAYFTSGRERLAQLEAAWRATLARSDAHARGRAARDQHRRALALPALAALRAAADRLAPLEQVRPASVQLEALEAFLRAVEEPPRAERTDERQQRARGAIFVLIGRLRDAFRRFGDAPLAATELAALLRRSLEEQTFSPRVGPGLVHLVDAQAAPYGHFADVTLVGLVEGEWPDAGGRQIFYPGSLLTDLGWPAESDRRAAARAAFDDLLRLPIRSLTLSSFQLEDDALVRPSMFIEDLEDGGLERLVLDEAPAAAARLAVAARGPGAVDENGEWARLRASRIPHGAASFHGAVGSLPSRAYAVTAIDRYRECPFRYFSADILALDEERDDEPGLTPQARGELVHRVFHQFFDRWTAAGRGAIDVGSLDAARALFLDVVDVELGTIPETERAIERARLLGSPVGAGLGERAFRFEASRPVPVIERLLEFGLAGDYGFEGPAGDRQVALRGTADRIDLLGDGTLRLLDYKTGKASKARTLLQVPIYGICAEARLAARHGRQWQVGDAGYLAFGRDEPFVSIVTPENREAALRESAGELVAAVDAIEAGRFPVQPDDLFTCSYCGFAAVCRKDYVGDE